MIALDITEFNPLLGNINKSTKTIESIIIFILNHIIKNKYI